MLGVEGEVVVGKDILGELDKELSGGRALIEEMFQGREAMSKGDVGV